VYQFSSQSFPAAFVLKRFARADDRDVARLRLEPPQRRGGHVRHLDEIVPRWMVLGQARVHLAQPAENFTVKVGGDYSQQVDIAALLVEVSGDEGTVPVQADEGMSQAPFDLSG
jgi:hypothetical protein